MLEGFLGKLTGQALRDMARNLFPGFYSREISANQALTELRSLGLGYRRQDFLADFRSGLAGYNQATTIGRVGDQFVPREGILQSLYHGTPDRYSLVFKATGTDPATGEELTRYFFQHRNSLDTVGNMKEDAKSWAEEQAVNYPIEIDNIRLIEGYVNPAWEGGE